MTELNLEIEALKTKLYEARAERDEARDELRERCDDLDEQQQDMNKLRDEVEAAVKERKQANEKHEQLVKMYSKLEGEVSRLRHESSFAHAEVDKLADENKALKEALAAAQKRIHLQESALTAVGLVLKGFLGTHQQEQG